MGTPHPRYKPVENTAPLRLVRRLTCLTHPYATQKKRSPSLRINPGSWVRLQKFKLTINRSFKYLCHAGIEPKTRSAAVERLTTAPNVPSSSHFFYSQVKIIHYNSIFNPRHNNCYVIFVTSTEKQNLLQNYL